MRGRKSQKPKPLVVVFEEDYITRQEYSQKLRNLCELLFVTNRDEIEIFLKTQDFRSDKIRVIVCDSHFSEPKHRISGSVRKIRARGYDGKIIATSKAHNKDLLENGADYESEKSKVPELVLQILGLD